MTPPALLIAELTHRCPLQCAYCSNPLELYRRDQELPKEAWLRTINEAAELGIHHVSFTGGEPLLYPGLDQLIQLASSRGLYTNLITSGVGLTENRLMDLANFGLDHIQLSLQDIDMDSAKEISGKDVLAQKIKVAKWISARNFGFTINIVVHRKNLSRLEEMISWAQAVGADKVEIAHVQYLGWALKNRSHLLPTKEQVREATVTIAKAKKQFEGQIKIDHVLPDYFGDFPKACLGGWGTKLILVNPAGLILPCHSAQVLPGAEFPSLQSHSLAAAWTDSKVFQMFRGQDWMKEPCLSCDRKAKDFGGCRCQAYLLTGDARAADPVCKKSEAHSQIVKAQEGLEPSARLEHRFRV